MKKVYLMRHGEVYNPKKIIYGRLPRFSITDKGKERIHKLIPFFRKKNITAIYSSPLLRARQTAKIIAQGLDLDIRYSKRIIEIKLFCEGMDLKTFKNKYQPYIYDKKYLKKGQEKVEEILERMLKFLKTIEKNNKEKNILVVSHGDPIVILRSFLEAKKFTFTYKKDNYIQTGEFKVLVKKDNSSKWELLQDQYENNFKK